MGDLTVDDPETRARRIRAGVSWIGALAVIWAVAAPIQIALARLGADQAALGDEAADRGVALAIAILALDLAPACAMAGLWVWARRRARPAMTAALALYLVSALVNALLRPLTLLGSLLITAVTLAILGRGLKAAGRTEPGAPPRTAVN